MTSENQKSPTLLVLAAGLGTRYGGLKQLEQIGPHGETLMDYSIYDAKQAGFTRVVFLIRQEMREQFMTISDGDYAGILYSKFGRERVNAEMDKFLDRDFFPRFGGGIGVTRMMRALDYVDAQP